MSEWGVIKESDIIIAKDRANEGTLLNNGNVLVNETEQSMQKWLKELHGWFNIQTYVLALRNPIQSIDA